MQDLETLLLDAVRNTPGLTSGAYTRLLCDPPTDVDYRIVRDTLSHLLSMGKVSKTAVGGKTCWR
jgi:hypothetical protein